MNYIIIFALNNYTGTHCMTCTQTNLRVNSSARNQNNLIVIFFAQHFLSYFNVNLAYDGISVTTPRYETLEALLFLFFSTSYISSCYDLKGMSERLID